MEVIDYLSQIRLVLSDTVKVLEEVSNQASFIESQVKNVAGNIHEIDKKVPDLRTSRQKPNVIPFPVSYNKPVHSVEKHIKPEIESTCASNSNNSPEKPFLHDGFRKHPFLVPILAEPGEPMPVTIPDFRDFLQRDGLILLSWDKQVTEKGELFTAYWVTSTGICRYFASTPLPEEEFPNAQPDHKSYAAEDGIEYYGQPCPYYVVHVAPELMMNHRNKIDERPQHIKKLTELGVKNNFEHLYLLTKEKRLFPSKHTKNGGKKNGA